MWHKIKIYQACKTAKNLAQNNGKNQSVKTNIELAYMLELANSDIETIL